LAAEDGSGTDACAVVSVFTFLEDFV
jgi:hypothetical protein